MRQQGGIMVDTLQGNWTTTDELPPLEGFFDQPRVVEALDMTLGIGDKGYHCLLIIPEGIGSVRAVVREYTEEFVRANWRDAPVYDYCYVLDFEDLHSPRPLRLSKGKGREFSGVMKRAQKVIMRRIRQMRSGGWFHREFTAIGGELDRFVRGEKERFEKEFEDACGVAVPFSSGAVGWSEAFFVVPVLDAQATDMFTEDFTPDMTVNIPFRDDSGRMSSRVFVNPYHIREWLKRFPHLEEDKRTELAESVVAASPGITQKNQETQDRRISFPKEAAEIVFDSVLQEAGYVAENYPETEGFISGLREFLGENFANNHETIVDNSDFIPLIPETNNSILTAFTVNVIGDRGDLDAAPVIWEGDPTFLKMVGQVLEPERRMTQQGLVTAAYDQRALKPGAILDANDGVLIFPFLHGSSGVDVPTWKILEEALEAGEFAIEDIGDRLPLSNRSGTGKFKSKPVPLNIRVVVVINEDDYELIFKQNPTFFRLFRVRAKFVSWTERTPESEEKVARFLSRSSKLEGLLPCATEAVPSFVEFLSQLAKDKKKLSLNMGAAKSLHIEADFWARKDGVTVITPEYVQKALDRQKYRARVTRERLGFLKDW